MIARIAGDRETAFIGNATVTPGDAGIVELFIREVRTDVADETVSFAPKDLQSELLLGGQCVALTVDKTVIRRISGQNAADVTRQCSGQRRCIHLHPRGCFFQRQIHLIRVLDRLDYLLF